MIFSLALRKGLAAHMPFILHVISLIVGCRWAILQIFAQLISPKPLIKSIILLFISSYMKSYVSVQILEIVENLFSGCGTCVKWGNSWSTEFQIVFSVRQGSVLSPFLFAIYVDDLCALCKPGSNLYTIRRLYFVTSAHCNSTGKIVTCM